MPFQITGRVTVNGRGRSSVAVSNGETVARTDRSGLYRLRVDPARHRFVFVVTPDDARPVDAFYMSTQDWTGPQAEVDFALQPAPERRRRAFAFAQFTDFHVQAKPGETPFPAGLREDLRRALSGWEPAFAIATGDLTNLGDLPSLKVYRKIAASAPCPVFPMFGGHDGLARFRSSDYAEGDACTRHFETILGPTHYSFDWGGRHFVIFPNEDHFFALPERETKGRWLAADLKAHAGRETLLFTHVPPTAPFLGRLARMGVSAVFHGHWHSAKAHAHRGIPVFATPCFPYGAIDTSPRGSRRVWLQGGRMRTELVPIARTSARKKIAEPRPGRRAQRPLRLLWSRRIDAEVHRAAPVVAGNRVLLALRDEAGDGRQGVLCLSLDTGRPLWRLQTDASVKNAVAVSNGLAVAVSVTGRVTAFDPATGAERWRTDLPGYPDRWIYASPAIAEDVIYAGGKAGYGAYDLKTGKQLWYTGPFDTRSDAWSCYASPVIAGDLLILLVQRLGIVALNRASGQEVWRQKIDVEYMYPQPVVSAGRALTCGEGGDLTALDLKGGRVLWRRKLTPLRNLSGLGADGSGAYVTSYLGEVRSYSLSGRLRWTFEVGPDLLDMTPYLTKTRMAIGGPVPMGDHLAVGANDGHLYLLDRRTGAELDRWGFGSPISAPPCAAGDRLVAASFDGLVACFEVRQER
ncbi:MAG: hypothetical protein EXS64_14650 [Candidatus Latescibacteria bacterium]|nr:hypothetical protein [Candidatus Latescibacterota bacterium]